MTGLHGDRCACSRCRPWPPVHLATRCECPGCSNVSVAFGVCRECFDALRVVDGQTIRCRLHRCVVTKGQGRR